MALKSHIPIVKFQCTYVRNHHSPSGGNLQNNNSSNDDGGGTGNKAYEDVETPEDHGSKDTEAKSEGDKKIDLDSGPRSLTGGTRV